MVSPSVEKAWECKVHPLDREEVLSERRDPSQRVFKSIWKMVHRVSGILLVHLSGSVEYVRMNLGTSQRVGNEEVPAFLEPYPVEREAMEAITSIAPLHRRLSEEGYEVHIAHPKETRSIAKARIKTDRTSSRALAELLRVNCLPRA
jgi:hypothetical protein